MSDNYETGFEMFPGSKGEVTGEQLARAAEWENAMDDNVPEFAGEQFGVANEANGFYGESASNVSEDGEENAA